INLSRFAKGSQQRSTEAAVKGWDRDGKRVDKGGKEAEVRAGRTFKSVVEEGETSSLGKTERAMTELEKDTMEAVREVKEQPTPLVLEPDPDFLYILEHSYVAWLVEG
ncbi:hypothetical protein A2U01_0065577, partial [Trifolium medium]|nr:hypothetical protein [Trifolium medium]